MIEAGIGDILMYIGGYLVVGNQDWSEAEVKFKQLGFTWCILHYIARGFHSTLREDPACNWGFLMSGSWVLVDIGSNFHSDRRRHRPKAHLAQSSAPTTIEDEHRPENVLQACDLMQSSCGRLESWPAPVAAGGLALVAIGLRRTPTAKAARLAALGAAGKWVLGTYSFQLTEADRRKSSSFSPTSS